MSWWPFSSSTRNTALGRASFTTAETLIASSFAITLARKVPRTQTTKSKQAGSRQSRPSAGTLIHNQLSNLYRNLVSRQLRVDVGEQSCLLVVPDEFFAL